MVSGISNAVAVTGHVARVVSGITDSVGAVVKRVSERSGRSDGH